ncbi:hypothetical protein [Endozoicomonas acroporae]|uniref:hypothetical protein n=1 Tax=Endozoicomonas acroporae TaxID=1701104 RepID=UPI003D7ABA90
MKTILLRSPRLPSDPFLDRAEKSAANAAASEQAAAESQDAAQQSASGSAQSSQLADESRVKAEAAQGKAETAQQAAEAAQGKAETAQQAAEAAQGKAETAQQAAETAQSKTEQSEAAALKSATDAAGDAAVTLDQASKAIDANNAAQVAKSEAIRAKEDATAIVHNDEGSVTPRAGNYPVADSKGHLDIGWTPLLQAMYPYSGVIGSVDKGDLFVFYGGSFTGAGESNKFRMRDGAYNINGRFVSHDWREVTLPEAEATASRAVAFDDIFIDWNNNVRTYRSVTPHRTITGYDRDAIATEHGYSKVQTGLYKTSDTYALLLGRVARRNWGVYHPVHNPEGSGSARTTTQTNGYKPWWNAQVVAITSKESAFDRAVKSLVNSGYSGKVGAFGNVRPDKKFYDAIYADDFTPLYYSAKNVVDRQALLFDSFNRAVAGETFSGAEGTTELRWIASRNKIGHPFSDVIDIDDSIKDTDLQYINNGGWESDLSESRCRLWDSYAQIVIRDSKGNYERYVPTNPVHAQNRHIHLGYSDESTPLRLYLYRAGGQSSNLSNGKIDIFVTTKGAAARPQFLMVDIIGSLDAMPDEWKTNGIPGNWLAVGEEGENLIPDGTSKNFKLSRKCLQCYQVLASKNKGVTWANDTHSWKSVCEGAQNGRTAQPLTGTCYMVFYSTSANPFELSNNSNSYADNDAFLHGYHQSSHGALLGSWLIGKIPTATGFGDTYSPISKPKTPLSTHRYSFTKYNLPEHQSGLSPSFSGSRLAIKELPYLVAHDGQSFLQIVYKEMKHNGTRWGDDNKFNIVNKQSTITDLNGETVIVGQKRVELPYHFDGVTY